ncbi:MAG: restriction endonuclease, SacI family, partial [Chloroflexi bacterium]|nr:restriction endonuclease, SacI family [Chloroflexota bacterium]
RISLDKVNHLIAQYLATGSGGDRMEAVCTALFQTIGNRFGLFDDVKREKVNAPDAFSGMLADIECRLEDRIVLLVEVKDRSLTLVQLDDKLDHVRAKHIAEILFIAKSGKYSDDAEKMEARISSEFASGHNIYVTNFFDFALGILILLGEAGRVEFLDRIGRELDRVHSDIVHRKAWAQLLKTT